MKVYYQDSLSYYYPRNIFCFLYSDGSRVDYEKMSNSEVFVDYCKEVAKLKFIRPENYGQNKRKAFFINIYNSLTIHAMVYQASVGNLPESPMKVMWK